MKKAAEPKPPGSFYDPPKPLPPGPPGTLIRVEPLEGAPDGASASKILYKSTDLHGREVAVSGVVVVPNGPAPEGGRNVVAWAHPTTGIARRCAPSNMPHPLHSVMGTKRFIADGSIVVATDYQGLGGPGVHPFLVGKVEAWNVLDSVRAAGNLPEWHAGKRFIVWGHSQGGQAAFFAATERWSYAPELSLLGVAVAAPATELRALFKADEGTLGGKGLELYAVKAWSEVYDEPLEPLMTPNAMQVMPTITQDCIESKEQFLFFGLDLTKLDGPLTTEDPAEVEPWKGLMEENSTRVRGVDTPVFIAQGTADTVVDPTVTRQFAHELCEAGLKVELDMVQGGTHVPMGHDAAPRVAEWAKARFADEPPPSNCKEPPASK